MFFVRVAKVTVVTRCFTFRLNWKPVIICSVPQSSPAIALFISTFLSTKSCVALTGHASGGNRSRYDLKSHDITDLYVWIFEFNLNGVSGDWFIAEHALLTWRCIDKLIPFNRRAELVPNIDPRSSQFDLPIRNLNLVDCGRTVQEFCFPEFIFLGFINPVGFPARGFEESAVLYMISDAPREWHAMSTKVVLHGLIWFPNIQIPPNLSIENVGWWQIRRAGASSWIVQFDKPSILTVPSVHLFIPEAFTSG